MRGDLDHVRPLSIEEVSRIHFRGGSQLGIARANPTKDPRLLETTVQALERLGVSRLITIGGDDTAFSAMKIEETARGRLQVVHVPKTIDNDLDLPAHVDTVRLPDRVPPRVGLVQSLMVDAETTGPLVLRRRDGAESGAPGARDRQGCRRDPDVDPGGVRRRPGQARDRGRHARRRHPEAFGSGASRRRRRHRGGRRAGARSRRSRAFRRGRTRRARSRASRRDRPR